jgi:riboflavin biosynthesis pyrimidine reductase
MAIMATLVVGADGSTSKGSHSSGVTSSVDRKKFLARRRLADCILIGGKTARIEPYHRTPVPVVVISRSMINALADNRLAHWWNLSPVEGLKRAQVKFGPNILIEAGASMITELLEARAIDSLELSVTKVMGGENAVDIKSLLGYFKNVEESQEEGTLFYSARDPHLL